MATQKVKQMTVWAYYRVSTDKQDYESQRFGVVEYAKRIGLTIDKEITDDGVSGTVKATDRKLNVILKNMKAGDTIIVSELSRLGRSTADVINTCNKIAAKNVYCYMVKQGMFIDQSPMGKMMIAIFAAFAEMERDLISQRTKEALARKKAIGERVGRAIGTKNLSHKLDGKHDKIKEMYQAGYSARLIAKTAKVSPTTMNSFLRESGLLDKTRAITTRLKQTVAQREKKQQTRKVKKIQSLVEQNPDKVIKTIYGYICGSVRIYCD